MLTIAIPGAAVLQLSYLILDFNGTLARDGDLVDDVGLKIRALDNVIDVHVITADTYGTVQRKLSGLPCVLHIIGSDSQDRQKQDYILSLGPDKVVAIGNGRNDCLMLKSAALGIALIQEEGASLAAVLAADIVCRDLTSAFDLLLLPRRVIATLRN